MVSIMRRCCTVSAIIACQDIELIDLMDLIDLIDLMDLIDLIDLIDLRHASNNLKF